jgi:hypothetical protein
MHVAYFNEILILVRNHLRFEVLTAVTMKSTIF